MDHSHNEAVGSAYYLGIDGGGSKTLAVIVDAQGVERGRGQTGSANYEAVGIEQATKHIFAAIAEAKATLAGDVVIDQAWLGLAGVDRPADFDVLLPYLNPIARSVRLTNDAELLLSALPDAIGITLIAGTGSITLGRNEQGVIVRAGGWGHILGDEGSGYDLGRQALQAAVRAADGRGRETRLLPLILQYWQIAEPDDLIGATYSENSKARIAKLSTCVFQAAREGDEMAQALVEQAARELALAVETVSRKLGYHKGQRVALAFGGGLLLNERDFRARVEVEIEARQCITHIYEVEQPALSAARALCPNHLG